MFNYLDNKIGHQILRDIRYTKTQQIGYICGIKRNIFRSYVMTRGDSKLYKTMAFDTQLCCSEN